MDNEGDKAAEARALAFLFGELDRVLASDGARPIDTLIRHRDRVLAFSLSVGQWLTCPRLAFRYWRSAERLRGIGLGQLEALADAIWIADRTRGQVEFGLSLPSWTLQALRHAVQSRRLNTSQLKRAVHSWACVIDRHGDLRIEPATRMQSLAGRSVCIVGAVVAACMAFVVAEAACRDCPLLCVELGALNFLLLGTYASRTAWHFGPGRLPHLEVLKLVDAPQREAMRDVRSG
ncbi:hypothetical protein [Pelomonas sp. KK5]|uniref:hypothetical protein n=1 Tax=Pelomonas sp. KK5 TaxID=1855730 RepID=UPI00117D2FDA|nr:hypothetical protein [Pelomonas sp. KK5]